MKDDTANVVITGIAHSRGSHTMPVITTLARRNRTDVTAITRLTMLPAERKDIEHQSGAAIAIGQKTSLRTSLAWYKPASPRDGTFRSYFAPGDSFALSVSNWDMSSSGTRMYVKASVFVMTPGEGSTPASC